MSDEYKKLVSYHSSLITVGAASEDRPTISFFASS